MIASSFVRGVSGVYDVVKEFMKHLAYCMRNFNKVYAPVFAVVQSSGCGKSKLLIEVCKDTSIPVSRYLCFRDICEQAAPVRTDTLTDYVLTEVSRVLDWVIFFVALISTVSNDGSGSHLLSSSSSQTFHTTHPFLLSYDPVFCHDVTALYESLKRSLNSGSVEEVNRQDDAAAAAAAVSNNREGSLYQAVETEIDLLVRTSPEFMDVIESIPLSHHRVVPACLIVLDEVGSGLLAANKASFLNMRRASAVLRSFVTVIVVLVDTNSKVSNLVPDLSANSTHRIHTTEHLLLPFYALPVPVAGLKVRTDISTIRACITNKVSSTVVSVTFNPLDACFLSRPMYVSEIQSTGVVRPAVLANVVQLAVNKMLNRDASPHEFASPALLLALISARFYLSTTVFTEQEELVRGHAACLTGISEAEKLVQRRIQVGYLSEPMVMEAAIRLMNKDENSALAVLRYMCERLQQGNLLTTGGQGETGELIGCYILQRAYDVAASSLRRPGNDDNKMDFLGGILSVKWDEWSDVMMTKPIMVALVLEQLCANGAVADILALSEDSLVRSIVLRGVVRYTHTIKLMRDQLTKKCLHNCLRVGAMILCAFNEAAIDAVIPCAVPLEGATVMDLQDQRSYNVAAVSVQIKLYNTAQLTPTKLLTAMQNHPLCSMLDDRVICLVMNVGGKEPPQKFQDRDVVSEGKLREGLRNSKTQKATEPGLFSSGLSENSRAYPCLSAEEVDLLKKMHRPAGYWDLFVRQQLLTNSASSREEILSKLPRVYGNFQCVGAFKDLEGVGAFEIGDKHSSGDKPGVSAHPLVLFNHCVICAVGSEGGSTCAAGLQTRASDTEVTALSSEKSTGKRKLWS
jgi:hypothetical protein